MPDHENHYHFDGGDLATLAIKLERKGELDQELQLKAVEDLLRARLELEELRPLVDKLEEAASAVEDADDLSDTLTGELQKAQKRITDLEAELAQARNPS